MTSRKWCPLWIAANALFAIGWYHDWYGQGFNLTAFSFAVWCVGVNMGRLCERNECERGRG